MTLDTGKIEAAVSQRRFDSLAALLHRDIRKAYHVEIARMARTHVYLHFNKVGVDPEDAALKVLKSIPSQRSSPLRRRA